MSDIVSRLESIVSKEQITLSGDALDRLSKDFYWYSPILKKQLADKTAEIAVSPRSVDELKAVIKLAFEMEIPVTPRGAGTGNYGQSIPLYGGILIDLMSMDKIIEINPEGYAVAEPGVRLAVLEETARKYGWELRCYPSTFVKSSLGGFVSGGSGGIGSITYGGLRDNNTVRKIELLTAEAEPRILTLEGDAIFPALRAYGTNGILVKIELALGRKVDWAQLAATFDTFDASLDFAEDFAQNSPYQKRLVTCFEPKVTGYFTPLRKYLDSTKAAVFLEMDTVHLSDAAERVAKAGGKVALQLPYKQPRQGPLLSDYTWNHTTLWAIKSDPALTYLQCGFSPGRLREQLKQIKDKYHDDYLIHLEFARSADGTVGVGMLPLIRHGTEERLVEMIEYSRSIGMFVSNNPHSCGLDKNEGADIRAQRAELKKRNDPKALLNPGKMPGYPVPENLLSKI